MLQQPADGSMACLMKCNGLFLLRGDDLAFLLQTTNYTINGIQEILLLHRIFTTSGGYQCCLIAHIGYVSS